MKWKRLGSTALALVLVCCLVFNMMMVPAKATGFLETAAIVGLSSVNVPAVLAVGATLVALGIMANTDTNDWQYMIHQAVDALESTGEWIKDGSIEMMKAVTAAGETVYYAAGDLFETVRSWAFDTGFVSTELQLSDSIVSFDALQANIATLSDWAFSAVIITSSNKWWLVRSQSSLFVDSLDSVIKTVDGTTIQVRSATNSSFLNWTDIGSLTIGAGCSVSFLSYGDCVTPSTTLDLTLGHVSNTAIDYDLYPEAYSDYMRSQLRVINTGGGQNPDDGSNPWKWFLPLALGATLTQIAGSTQEQQWTAETPEEFPEGDTVTEFEILATPEIDGLPGIEISPVTQPDADPDVGGDSSTDSESDNDPYPGSGGHLGGMGGRLDETEPGSFLDNLLNAFADPFQWIGGKLDRINGFLKKIASGEITLSQALSQILSAIVSLPETLIDLLGQLLASLFVPAEGFLDAKFDALAAKYGFVNSITESVNVMSSYLQGLGSTPPVIWIDLGATRGSYNIGGKIKFIDLTWYAEYKPTVDAILTAFLWLWFVWRVRLSLPGIIAGTSGFWERPDPVADIPFRWSDDVQGRLGSGDYSRLGAGDGKIYSGPAVVPPERRLGWRNWDIKERDRRK